MLTTTGRRTGRPRSTMLTAPILEDRRIVVVASNGGADRDPGWLENVRVAPDVTVLHAGHTRSMRARVASDRERDELWPIVSARYVGYDLYQRSTEREIPLVILED
jgi:deazaflavin-dependent oxidoreductase (nitroreductase family)